MSSDAINLDFDIGLIASGGIPPVDGGAALTAFTDAITADHLSDLTTVRADLVAALGPVGAERAVSIASTFQMMNRALDGVGAPIGADLYPIAKQLGFEPADITR